MKHGLDKPEDELMVKKPRTEESLEPEYSFLAKNQVSNLVILILPYSTKKKFYTSYLSL